MKQQTLQGVPEGEFTEEQLKAEQERVVIEKQQIIADLNKIKHPLNVTVFTHGQAWTIRNKSFWEQMQKRDEDIIEFMQNYLSERK